MSSTTMIILELATSADDLKRLGYERIWDKYGEKALDLLYPSTNQDAPIGRSYLYSKPLACVVNDFLVRVPCNIVRYDNVTDTWWMREDDWTEFVT